LTVTFFQQEDGGALLLLAEKRRKSFDEISKTLPLTAREREIFAWICEAKTNPEIAAILGLSQRTVHKHVERILGKLGVENRLQAQRFGWEMQTS